MGRKSGRNEGRKSRMERYERKEERENTHGRKDMEGKACIKKAMKGRLETCGGGRVSRTEPTNEGRISRKGTKEGHQGRVSRKEGREGGRKEEREGGRISRKRMW
jgi:hypothetical protein